MRHETSLTLTILSFGLDPFHIFVSLYLLLSTMNPPNFLMIFETSLSLPLLLLAYFILDLVDHLY